MTPPPSPPSTTSPEETERVLRRRTIFKKGISNPIKQRRSSIFSSSIPPAVNGMRRLRTRFIRISDEHIKQKYKLRKNLHSVSCIELLPGVLNAFKTTAQLEKIRNISNGCSSSTSMGPNECVVFKRSPITSAENAGDSLFVVNEKLPASGTQLVTSISWPNVNRNVAATTSTGPALIQNRPMLIHRQICRYQFELPYLHVYDTCNWFEQFANMFPLLRIQSNQAIPKLGHINQGSETTAASIVTSPQRDEENAETTGKSIERSLPHFVSRSFSLASPVTNMPAIDMFTSPNRFTQGSSNTLLREPARTSTKTAKQVKLQQIVNQTSNVLETSRPNKCIDVPKKYGPYEFLNMPASIEIIRKDSLRTNAIERVCSVYREPNGNLQIRQDTDKCAAYCPANNIKDLVSILPIGIDGRTISDVSDDVLDSDTNEEDTVMMTTPKRPSIRPCTFATIDDSDTSTCSSNMDSPNMTVTYRSIKRKVPLMKPLDIERFVPNSITQQINCADDCDAMNNQTKTTNIEPAPSRSVEDMMEEMFDHTRDATLQQHSSLETYDDDFVDVVSISDDDTTTTTTTNGRSDCICLRCKHNSPVRCSNSFLSDVHIAECQRDDTTVKLGTLRNVIVLPNPSYGHHNVQRQSNDNSCAVPQPGWRNTNDERPQLLSLYALQLLDNDRSIQRYGKTSKRRIKKKVKIDVPNRYGRMANVSSSSGCDIKDIDFPLVKPTTGCSLSSLMRLSTDDLYFSGDIDYAEYL